MYHFPELAATLCPNHWNSTIKKNCWYSFYFKYNIISLDCCKLEINLVINMFFI